MVTQRQRKPARCDSTTASNLNNLDDVADSYPNFSRHGSHSLLKKYLTPEVYKLLRDRKTSSGVTLEDMIQSGVSLPLGAKPPRGVGLYTGDADCYKTFAPLLDPLIAHYHDTSATANFERSQRLKRQVTLLRPDYVLSQRPDPTGEYILYTRMRVARSVNGFPFAPNISRADRRTIEKIFRECVQDWQQQSQASSNSEKIPATLRSGKYISVYEMSNEQHDDLIQRHILFHDPDEWALIANLGRDWPDARGLYCSDWNEYLDPYSNKVLSQNSAITSMVTPQLMIWCNAEDHIRIISMNKGGDLRGVFTTLVEAVQALERSLQNRGHGFCYHPVYGFLNTSPTNIGTALRASVFVKLVRLGQQPGFSNLIQRLKLEAHTRYAENDKRYTGIFDISNAERFGKNETQLINIMIQGVHKLIELEKKLERGEVVNLEQEG
jgi:protein-arginine kinase